MEARYKRIRNLFGKSGVRFVVPPYQRGYKWGKKNLEDLWFDLQRINGDTEQHYLGSIILLEKENGTVYEIVDGQQRMVTISILMMAIRDAPNFEHENERRIDDIINTYPKNEKEKKLTLADESADDNYHKIWKGDIEEAEQEIKSSYDFYVSKVSSLSNDELSDLIDRIINGLHVVETVSKDVSLAYTIFQSQNERGKEVSPQILAKARIHGAAEELDDISEKRKVKSQWDHIYRLLEKNLGSPRFQADLRVRRPMTQILINSPISTPTQIDKGALYRNFENVLNNFDGVVEFVDWFQSQVDIYLELYSNSYHVSGRNISDDSIRSVQYLNSASTHSEVLSLAIYNNVEKDVVMKESFRLASILAMRMELGGSSSASTRDAIYTTARDVREAEDDAEIRKVIKEDIKSKTPSNPEIKEHIKANPMYIRGPWNFRNLLKLVSIEEAREGPWKIEEDKLHIEHIAPQNIEKPQYAVWRQTFDEDEFEDLRDKVGNLTLLLPGDHAGLDETSFDSKKNTYRNSKVNIAEEVAEYDSWTEENLNDRTELLAKELINRWSI